MLFEYNSLIFDFKVVGDLIDLIAVNNFHICSNDHLY